MDELLGAIQQRNFKIEEMKEEIERVKQSESIQQERGVVYCLVRKLKEEEKVRAEKENWIIGIIRNTKQYNEEQMCHIYIKTNEMMKAISSQFIEIPYLPPCNMYQYLENYYALHISFQKHLNQDIQLKVQFKQAVRAGNISLVTDLIKSLLSASRKKYRDCLDELSTQVQKDSPPQKLRLENQRTRSSTQKIDELKQSQKSFTTLISRVDRLRKKQVIISKIQRQYQSLILSSCELSPTTESPMLKNKFKEVERNPFVSMFANITPVIDDLDEQNIQICDYQTTKRQQQNYEEFKTNYDTLCEKIRIRNIFVQQSVSDYNNYALRKVQNIETEYPNLIREKYTTLQNNQDYHFCNIQLKPIFDSMCACMQKPPLPSKQSPIKNKVIIRKPVQVPKRQGVDIDIGQSDQPKKECFEPYKHQNSPSNSKSRFSVQPFKLYKESFTYQPNRAQSANSQQQQLKYLTCSSFLENPIVIKTNLLVRSTYQ